MAIIFTEDSLPIVTRYKASAYNEGIKRLRLFFQSYNNCRFIPQEIIMYAYVLALKILYVIFLGMVLMIYLITTES